jgi:phospholipid/cholesterol/gamma-HCH transport system substrate-binding protein
MKTNSIEAVMGAVVLVVAGFFLFFAYNASQKNIGEGYVLYGKFTNISGITVGSDIKISGVKVGSVKKITVDPDTYQARVELSIHNTYRLPEDSSISIVSEGFMGGKYIDVQAGGSETMLDAGEEFLYTQSSISFEALLGKFIFSNSNTSTSPSKTANDIPAPAA